ncbi:MAG TPA: glutathione S-transferase family protein [Brevundimonas sp.]|jgi:glutathione S-transferase|uniref:FtsZ-binding protein FzlA n=1 Tax=Brevundimonas sp. TaxID=1871086 RepID=UPI002C3355B5|nr:glutathione S-transferase family protein [Brevundimonas sp.]HRH19935.1 glutathione S-transferase family protein [Brevundimonas sp.]
MSQSLLLHHFSLDPASRQARLALGEKKLAYDERPVRYWEFDEVFHALSPTGRTPVLEVGKGEARFAACELLAVLDWIETQGGKSTLLPADPAERAEALRLRTWFDRKFEVEVDAPILYERMEKRLQRLGPPEAEPLRQGRTALKENLIYLEDLLGRRDWLAGRTLSLADLAAAAHLSVLDYFGEIAWRSYPHLKTWYMRLKSRPSFRPLLADRLPGMAPVEHYADLDF